MELGGLPSTQQIWYMPSQKIRSAGQYWQASSEYILSGKQIFASSLNRNKDNMYLDEKIYQQQDESFGYAFVDLQPQKRLWYWQNNTAVCCEIAEYVTTFMECCALLSRSSCFATYSWLTWSEDETPQSFRKSGEGVLAVVNLTS